MSEPFAKLFVTPHGQLLAFLDETDEGDPAISVIAASVGDIRPQAKLSGWDDDGGQARAFERIDQAAAEQFAADLRNAILGMFPSASAALSKSTGEA